MGNLHIIDVHQPKLVYNKVNREQGFQTEGQEVSEDQHLHVAAQFFTSFFPRGTPQAYESQFCGYFISIPHVVLQLQL